MELEEIIRTLNGFTGDDPHTEHELADDLLLQALRFCGVAAVAEAWESARERVGFWYS